MGIANGIALYLIIWWTVIFAVLPVGVQTQEEPPDGLPLGLPKKLNLKKKLAATTLISAVIWGIAFAVISSDLISFREMVKDW